MTALATPIARTSDILAALRRAPAGMRVPECVASYIGLPWRKKGRGWEGCDCWGVACLVNREQLGRALPDHAGDYEAKWLAAPVAREDLRKLAAVVERSKTAAFREIAFYEASLFDLMELPIAGEPCHIALYVGDLRILHIEEGCNAVCEDLREGRWHGRLRHARMYRFIGGSAC